MQYDDVLNEEFFPRIGVSSEEAFKLKETIENSNTMDGYNILGMSLRNNKEYILKFIGLPITYFELVNQHKFVRIVEERIL